jgi:hypothetical protein
VPPVLDLAVVPDRVPLEVLREREDVRNDEHHAGADEQSGLGELTTASARRDRHGGNDRVLRLKRLVIEPISSATCCGPSMSSSGSRRQTRFDRFTDHFWRRCHPKEASQGSAGSRADRGRRVRRGAGRFASRSEASFDRNGRAISARSADVNLTGGEVRRIVVASSL